MNAATEVKRHKLTQEDCDTVRYLLKYGRTLKEIEDIIKVDPSTVGKIRLANYDLQTYLEQRKEMNRKTKERKAAAEERRAEMFRKGPFDYANDSLIGKEDEERDKKILNQLIREEQVAGRYPVPEVPGQMKMDLEQKEEPEKQDEQTKQMKFQAAMVDKLLKKLDELIAVLKGGAGNE